MNSTSSIAAPSVTYREVKPHVALSDYVEAYWYFNLWGGVAQSFEVLPDGFVDLLMVFTDGRLQASLFTGIWSKRETVCYTCDTEVVGIRFKPLALYQLLDLRLKDYLDSTLLFTPQDMGIGTQQLLDAKGIAINRVFAYLEQQLLAMLPDRQPDRRRKYAFDAIYRSYGTLSVDEVARTVGFSTRHLHRVVSELVGIGVKDYAKIIRFNHALRLMRKHPLDFAGYYDQAHFIKDFKRYTGLTPGKVSLGEDVRFLQYYPFEGS